MENESTRAVTAVGEKAAKRLRRRRSAVSKLGLRHWQLWLLILPGLVYLVLFCYLPMYGVIVAFENYSPILGVFGSPWVGWTNFRSLFNSYWFEIMLVNTLELSLYSLPVNTIFPIVLALLINEVRHSWFKKSVQTISYAPYFVSVIVTVGMCYTFTDAGYGVVNKLFGLFGAEAKDWMYEPAAFNFIYILSGLWQGCGWWAIIYVAALSSVDPALHEAATIDGAGRFKRIWHINLPAILPTAIILFIMAMGGIMNVGFEKAFLMQNSSNLVASEIIATYAYKVSIAATGYKNYGFGAAVGLFNSVINIVLLLAANFGAKLLGKESLW